MLGFGNILKEKYSLFQSFRLIFMILLFIVSVSDIGAMNLVDLGMTCNGQNDTIWVGEPATFDVYIENDNTLMGMSIGFRIWSNNGATWQWQDVGGYGPYGLGTGQACITVVPECRMDPPTIVWSPMDFMVKEQDMDEVSPDSLLVGGSSPTAGLPPGALEHMISFHFIAGPETEGIYQLCIDSTRVPPAGDFIFEDIDGPVVPYVGWPSGGICWPVKRMPTQAPVFTNCPLEMVQAPLCDVFEYVLEGNDPDEDPLTFGLISYNGAGSAWVDAITGLLTCNFVEADMGSLVRVGVTVCDQYPRCDTCYFDIQVYNEALVIDCGVSQEYVVAGNTLVKSDIDVTSNVCLPLTYSIVSGPGTINPSNGVYTWNTTLEDIGDWEVEVEVTDGYVFDRCTFMIEVIEGIQFSNSPAEPLTVNNCNSLDYDLDVDALPGTTYEFDHVPNIICGWIDLNKSTGEFEYIPEPDEAGNTIPMAVMVCDDNGFCDTCFFDIVVNNVPPLLDCGALEESVDAGNTIVKADIIATDSDDCDNLRFKLISGPGTIDSITGDYSWNTTYDDIGKRTVMVQVTDGHEYVTESFEIIVLMDLVFDYTCGDANNDNMVNIGDAVFINNLVFHCGPPPDLLTAGDANCDGSINIGDAVFINNLVFHNGPAPRCAGAILTKLTEAEGEPAFINVGEWPVTKPNLHCIQPIGPITITPVSPGDLYYGGYDQKITFHVPTIKYWKLEDDQCVLIAEEPGTFETEKTIREIAEQSGPGKYTFEIGSNSDDCGCTKISKDFEIFLLTPVLNPNDNFPGRSVTHFGLEETIRLNFNSVPSHTATELGGLLWLKASGGGNLVWATLDGTGRYIASPAEGDVNFTLTIQSGLFNGMGLDTNLVIVAPNSGYITQKPYSGLRHVVNTASCGFLGYIYLEPKDVSFRALKFREGTCTGTGTGFYLFLNGDVHPISRSWLYISSGNINTGCRMMGQDRIYSGERNPPYSVGTFNWPIPWQYRTTTGDPVTYHTANHYQEADADGKVSIQKAGAGPFEKDAADPTSSW